MGMEVSQKDFEASIERSIDHVIAYDLKIAVAAAKNGKCLAEAAGNNKLAASFTNLMVALLDGAASESEDEGKSLLGNLKSLLATKGKSARAG
jgi:pilus assembly protein CpaE